MAGKDISFKVSAKDEATGTLNKVAGSVNSFSKETKDALKPLDNLNKSFTSLQKVFNPLTVGITAGIAAISKMTKAVGELTDAWAANQTAMKRVDFATTVNKSLTGASSALKGLASELSAATNGWFEFGDVLGSMSDLLFDKSYDQIEAITRAATDLAIATGTDLNTAVTQLNNTFAGNVGQLGKMIPELKTLTKEQLEAGEAVRIVAERVKGAGEAMSDTIEGTKKAAQDASDSLKSALGEAFSYLTQPMTNFFTRMKNELANLISNANNVKKAMREVESQDAQHRYDSAKVLRDNAMKNRQQNAFMLENIARVNGMTNPYDIQRFIESDSTQQKFVQEVAYYSGLMNAALDELSSLANDGYINVALTDSGDTAQVIAQATAEGTSAGTSVALGKGRIGAYDANFGSTITLAPAGSSGYAFTDIDDRRSNAGAYGTGHTWAGALLSEGFGALTEHVAALNELLSPMTIVLNSMWQVIEPAVTNIVAPLVGIFATLGQMLGAVIVPVLQTLSPVIELVSNAFVFLYNNVLRPISNGLIAMFNTVYNVIAAVCNGFIAMYNAIAPKKKEKDYIGYKSLSDGALGKIDAGSLAAAGNAYMGIGGGASASYTAARDITVNLTYSHSFVNGDAQEIAIQIKKELAAVTALGY